VARKMLSNICAGVLCLLLLFTGCGYQLGQGGLTKKYRTLSIPYVTGDNTGQLTAALVKEIVKSGGFLYAHNTGELILQVSVVDYFEKNVGFQYDRNKKGKREDYLIPIETRITAIADVAVIEACSGSAALPATRVRASVVFDHQYYFGSDEGIETSLGQLTELDTARDSVRTPLFNTLAAKIVAYIVQSW